MRYRFYYVRQNNNYLLKDHDSSAIFEVDSAFFQGLKQQDAQVLSVIGRQLLGARPPEQSRVLGLYLVTTMSCNLTCSYCFERDKQRERTLSCDQDLDKVVTRIASLLKQTKTDQVSITFTGGEPLMNFRFMQGLVDILSDRGLLHQVSLITNGTIMTTRILEWLSHHSVAVQISLDGDEEDHNLERQTHLGKGSFKRVMQTIERVSDQGRIDLTLRINVTGRNHSQLPRLFAKLKALDRVFNLYTDFVAVPREDPLYMSPKQRIQIYKQLYQALEETGFPPPSKLVSVGNCMYKNDLAVTIDASGHLVKCYSLVGDTSYQLEIDLIQGVGSLCHRRDCFYYEDCLGGCPFDRYVVDGEMAMSCRYQEMLELNRFIFIRELDGHWSDPVNQDQVELLTLEVADD